MPSEVSSGPVISGLAVSDAPLTTATAAAARLAWLGLSPVARVTITLNSTPRKKPAFIIKDVRLFLTNPESDPKSIMEQIGNADVILYAGCLSAGRDAVMDALFRSQNEKSVISLIETQTQNFRNMIVLDNYAAGRMAAEYLIASGCRKMLGIWEFCNNQDFSRRAQGFADSLAAHHFGGIESILWVVHGSASGMRETISWALSEGFDGLFLMSDEHISDLLRRPIASGQIPGKTKVVTIDGTQECLRMTPVLPYINHASDKIAEEILEQITLLARGTFRNVRKHLYPTLCKS